MDSPHLGLYRLMSASEQERAKREFGVSFADLFDSLDDARDLAQELERTVDRIFVGEPTDRMEGRS